MLIIIIPKTFLTVAAKYKILFYSVSVHYRWERVPLIKVFLFLSSVIFIFVYFSAANNVLLVMKSSAVLYGLRRV